MKSRKDVKTVEKTGKPINFVLNPSSQVLTSGGQGILVLTGREPSGGIPQAFEVDIMGNASGNSGVIPVIGSYGAITKTEIAKDQALEGGSRIPNEAAVVNTIGRILLFSGSDTAYVTYEYTGEFPVTIDVENANSITYDYFEGGDEHTDNALASQELSIPLFGTVAVCKVGVQSIMNIYYSDLFLDRKGNGNVWYTPRKIKFYGKGLRVYKRN